jgi:hypothetical protein
MPKFLVEHAFGKEYFERPEAKWSKEFAEGAKPVKASLSGDAYWIRSYIVPETGKLYCEYDGKDVE